VVVGRVSPLRAVEILQKETKQTKDSRSEDFVFFVIFCSNIFGAHGVTRPTTQDSVIRLRMAHFI